MINYSQNDEQDAITRFFGDSIGTFLDIGAYDGEHLSNTRALAELGWSGLMVEPDPFNVSKLFTLVGRFDGRVKVLAAAVCPDTKIGRLYVDISDAERGWASTLKPGSKHVIQPSNVNLLVPCINPDTLLGYGPFNFISIDAEYRDLSILSALPHEQFCDLLCIEPADMEQRELMRKLLVLRGFKIYHETPENILASR